MDIPKKKQVYHDNSGYNHYEQVVIRQNNNTSEAKAQWIPIVKINCIQIFLTDTDLGLTHAVYDG